MLAPVVVAGDDVPSENGAWTTGFHSTRKRETITLTRLRTSMAVLLGSATAVAGMSVLTAAPAVAGGQDTTLTCAPFTTKSGTNVLQCTATDGNGIKSIVVGTTGQNITTVCDDKARTVTFNAPADGIKRSVFIVDCANQRERAKFTIQSNGTVTGPTFTYV